MSATVIAKALAAHLRKALSLKDGEIDVTPFGRPKPECGQRFVGVIVHPTGPRDNPENAIDETFGATCVVTYRSPEFPVDRFNQLEENDEGIKTLCRRLMLNAHFNYTLLSSINSLTGGDSSSQYIEPLRWSGTTEEPEEVGPDWFGSRDIEPAVAGHRMEVRFSGLYRVQAVTGMS